MHANLLNLNRAVLTNGHALLDMLASDAGQAKRNVTVSFLARPVHCPKKNAFFQPKDEDLGSRFLISSITLLILPHLLAIFVIKDSINLL